MVWIHQGLLGKYNSHERKNKMISNIVKTQLENEKFEKEVISPLSDKIITEITSNKLTYNQTFDLLRVIEGKIKNFTVYSE